MIRFIEKHKLVIIPIIALFGLSLGLYPAIAIWQSLSVLLGLWGVGWYVATILKPDVEPVVVDQTTEIVEEYDKVIAEHEEILNQQNEVIQEYEGIFDSMLVKLPCICGGNTFEGLFPPDSDNEVVCENCKNKYRVTIQYDMVLISEPMNLEQPFDIPVGKDI